MRCQSSACRRCDSSIDWSWRNAFREADRRRAILRWRLGQRLPDRSAGAFRDHRQPDYQCGEIVDLFAQYGVAVAARAAAQARLECRVFGRQFGQARFELAPIGIEPRHGAGDIARPRAGDQLFDLVRQIADLGIEPRFVFCRALQTGFEVALGRHCASDLRLQCHDLTFTPVQPLLAVSDLGVHALALSVLLGHALLGCGSCLSLSVQRVLGKFQRRFCDGRAACRHCDLMALTGVVFAE